MRKKNIIIIGVVIVAILAVTAISLYEAKQSNRNSVDETYNIDSEVMSTKPLPIPSGDLTASESIPLPDLYETGMGFTCTGLAYDPCNNVFLVGDIGKRLPNSGTIASRIVKLSTDFETVIETIDLHTSYDIQGITLDSDGSVWYCLPSDNKIHHISNTGASIGSISVTSPTGIAYSPDDDSFWVLNYNNKILHISKTGKIIASYNFAYNETLDQCFLDSGRGLLYITAGANYFDRNNVYCFNITTHEQNIVCTVDSYSVEGIWVGQNKMVIVNDGHYHNAYIPINMANIYLLD